MGNFDCRFLNLIEIPFLSIYLFSKEDPSVQLSKNSVFRQQKADARFQEAVANLEQEKASKNRSANERLQFRETALKAEKERAAIIAALPMPRDPLLCDRLISGPGEVTQITSKHCEGTSEKRPFSGSCQFSTFILFQMLRRRHLLE